MADTPSTLVDGASTPASPPHQHHLHIPHHPHLHLHGNGRRLRQLLLPNGKKVHIAGSPEEVDSLRRRLSNIEKEGDYELVIHGSTEHLEALRHSHAHQEEKHRELSRQNPDLCAQLEKVLREMDTLSNELHMVSEHAVQLDANFSKYGYAANLRTRDSPEESRASLSLSSNSEGSFSKDEWQASRKLGTTMRFFQKPIIRQYFHKGLLWRAREAQEVASYELFIDLIYVGIIAATGDTAAEHATGESLLRFVVTFTMGWKLWSDISVSISWIDSDDILRRFAILFTLTCLLGMTTNMVAAWDTTWTPLVAFYVAARLSSAVCYFWYSCQIPMVRASMIGHAILHVIPSVLWIGSIHVREPGRQALIWPALFLDIFAPTLMIWLQMGEAWMSRKVSGWAKDTFEFWPAHNIEHKIERTGAFVTLVFGSSVLGILYQSNAEFGINAFFGKAVLGLIQAFVFNWLYFEIDAFNLHTHAIRRHKVSAGIWFSIHLPFIMAFALSSAALAVLVTAHDCSDAPVDTLYETYIPRSEEHIHSGLRWFYCGGLGIALACMGIISRCHVYRTIPNRRLGRNKTITIRFIVSIIIICLPLAGDRLNSLDLISITTALSFYVLFQELWAASCTDDNLLWDKRCTRNKANYSARCGISKRELWAKLAKGEKLNVEEIAKREGVDNAAVATACV